MVLQLQTGRNLVEYTKKQENKTRNWQKLGRKKEHKKTMERK